jgi:membrane protease YdiL (CAAX protease family)
MAPVDILFSLVLVVGAALFEHLWFWPHFKRQLASGDADARRRGYRRIIAFQLAFAAMALWIWRTHGRSAAELRMAMPAGWRLATSAALVALMIGFVVLQLRSVLRLSAERRVALRPKLGDVTFMLPHTRPELSWFLALSATAGVCEELLYRGYLVWLLSHWLGVPGAFVAVVVLFGLGHLYLGR